jgi:hypothetical protein
MDWSKVGEWLRSNAGPGAALVGSLMTANVPGAMAAGIAMVSSATGTASPDAALQTLQSDPSTVIRLRELAIQDEASVREHIRLIAKQELDDAQAEQKETQETIRTGDTAEDVVVRRTRPLQSWLSLLAALGYVFAKPDPNIEVLMLLLALPWAYAGLRQIGKGIESFKRR